MENRSLKIVNRLEAKRKKLIEKLRQEPEEKLYLRASEEEWSMAMLLNHFVQVEKESLRYINRKLQDEQSLKPVTYKNQFSNLLLTLALKSGKKFKIPEKLGDPPNTGTLEAINEEWKTYRNQMRKLIKEKPAEVLKKKVFKHPAAGPLNFKQSVSFIEKHHDHHMNQFERIIRSNYLSTDNELR